MQAQLLHGLTLALDWFNSINGHWYYTAGVVLASIPVTALIVEWFKHLHLKLTAVEMTNKFINFVIWVTGTLMAVADYAITQGATLQALSHFLPFLAIVIPTIKALAPDVYEVSKAIHSWFVTRQSEDQKQRLAATVKLANSFGTEANGITASVQSPQQSQQPEPTLLQL